MANLAIIFFHRIFRNKNIPLKNHYPLRIGHRGAAGLCPENTFASFDKAVQSGMEYIEMDVQMTKDGLLAIIHDPTLKRTTNGYGKVADFTLKEIQSLDAGSWYHSKFSGERIPSFTEFLDTYAGKIGLLIELKNPTLYPGIEEKVANELRIRGLDEKDQIIIQSFEQNSMKKFHRLMPSIPIGVLVRNNGKGITTNDLRNIAQFATFVNPKITMVNKRLVKKIHQEGLKILVWTVRNKKEAQRLQQLGVDGIITDFPECLPPYEKEDS